MVLQVKLRTATATAALRIANACGEQVTYTPTGGSAFRVYCIVGKTTYESAQSGGAIGDTQDQLTLVIPRQTGFPPASKIVDDQVERSDIVYRVTKVETDATRAIYTVTAAASRG